MVTRAQRLYYNNLILKALVLNQGHFCPPGDSWVSQLGENGQCFQHPVLTGQGYGSTSNNAEKRLQTTGLSGRKCHWCQRWESLRKASQVTYPDWPLTHSGGKAHLYPHFLELEHGLTFLPMIFSKLHPAWQHRHICTAQCFFLQANPKHHDVYLTLTNVCFINGSEFGDLPGKDKWSLTVYSTELRTCA